MSTSTHLSPRLQPIDIVGDRALSSAVSYSLRPRARSNDYDLVDASGAAIGQVIGSTEGFRIYLLGDLESLLDTYPTAEDALAAFEEWAASNTTDSIPVVETGS